MGDFIKTLTSLIGSVKAKVDGKIGILQKRIDDIPTETVLYTPQTLTEEQQKQARDNIGSDIFVITITEDEYKNEDGNWITVYKADKTFAEIADAINNNMFPICILPRGLIGGYEIGVCYYSSIITPPRYGEFFIFASRYDSEMVYVYIYENSVRVDTYSTYMIGATDKEYGHGGSVPRPNVGDQNKFLRGDATWADVPKYELPVAANEKLGGVKPVAKTDAMTQDVGVDENGKLYTEPAEGGTDISLNITGAAAGQIAKISAVDENGVPTAWEPVDMPSGGSPSNGELLLSAEASDVAGFSQSFDTKDYDKFLFFIGGTKGSSAISITRGNFYVGGMQFVICYYTGWLNATNTSYPNGCIAETFERVVDDIASVTYGQYNTALDPITTTFQGNASQNANMKQGYLKGATVDTPDGIALAFSGAVSYVKVAVYGYH